MYLRETFRAGVTPTPSTERTGIISMPKTSDPRSTALLILDCQTGYLEPVPGAESSRYSPLYAQILKPLASTRKSAKSAGVRVYYLILEFSEGHLEIGDRASDAFKRIRDKGSFIRGNPETPIHPDLAPEADDVVIVKHRVGAFSGTDLDRILRSDGIETITITGLATGGIVLSTVRAAWDLDYSQVILEDLCADSDAERHRALMERVFPMSGEVTTSDKWLAALSR